ncbi:MAG: hypothetical protein ABUL62_29950 [Myxococcales bacterium]
MIRGRIRLGALFSAGVLASCVTNHAALEKKPGGGHLGGVGGVGGASAGAGPTAGRGGASSSIGGHADDEPAGTSRLTIVNGVVDAPTVVVCLGKVDTDGSVTAFGDPIATLDYAESITLGELADVDATQDTLQPFLIAGNLKLIRGLDCEAAIQLARAAEPMPPAPPFEGEGGAAGADGGAAGAVSNVTTSAGEGGEGGAAPEVRSVLRVRGLPAIPAGTLDQGRSLALVANGCMGGATYGADIAEEYCGAGYTEQMPTLSAVLVNLSRAVSYDRVGIQVVHASLANDVIAVGTIPTPPLTGSGISIANSVSFGQVSPRPASVTSTVADLGSTRKVSVQVSSQGAVQFSEPWSQVLKSGGLTELLATHTYALVFSGPRADLGALPELWNAPALTAIAVDPE